MGVLGRGWGMGVLGSGAMGVFEGGGAAVRSSPPLAAHPGQASLVSWHSDMPAIRSWWPQVRHVWGQLVSITSASPHALRFARASSAQSGRASAHDVSGHIRPPCLRRVPTRSASASACAAARSAGSVGGDQSTLTDLTSPLAVVFCPFFVDGCCCTCSASADSMPAQERAQEAAMNVGLLAHSPWAAHVAQWGSKSTTSSSRFASSSSLNCLGNFPAQDLAHVLDMKAGFFWHSPSRAQFGQLGSESTSAIAACCAAVFSGSVLGFFVFFFFGGDVVCGFGGFAGALLFVAARERKGTPTMATSTAMPTTATETKISGSLKPGPFRCFFAGALSAPRALAACLPMAGTPCVNQNPWPALRSADAEQPFFTLTACLYCAWK